MRLRRVQAQTANTTTTSWRTKESVPSEEPAGAAAETAAGLGAVGDDVARLPQGLLLILMGFREPGGERRRVGQRRKIAFGLGRGTLMRYTLSPPLAHPSLARRAVTPSHVGLAVPRGGLPLTSAPGGSPATHARLCAGLHRGANASWRVAVALAAIARPANDQHRVAPGTQATTVILLGLGSNPNLPQRGGWTALSGRSILRSDPGRAGLTGGEPRRS